MPTLRQFVAATGVWSLTVVVYVASIGAAAFMMPFFDWGPAASALVWLGLIMLGPALLALRIGLPALPTIAALAALTTMYSVVLSLSNNSGYDTPRWDYGHLYDGLMIALLQAVGALCAVVAARGWHRYRGTEFSAAASHLKYRTR